MSRPYPFVQHRVLTGRIWSAGRSGFDLCAAWNHATNPALYLTDHEHNRSRQYARAIKNRMARIGVRYCETEIGTLFPLAAKRA